MSRDGYHPRSALPRRDTDASLKAAVAAAGHGILSHFFPSMTSTLDGDLADALASVSNVDLARSGQRLGEEAADRVLAERGGLPSGAFPGEAPDVGPMVWRPTPAGMKPYALPGWAVAPTWSIPHAASFRPAPAPSVLSDAYAKSIDEVRRLGSKSSAERSAEQTEIAKFWADGAGTETPPGHWNAIASGTAEGCQVTLPATIRMFAVLNAALADAAIAAWDAKWQYHVWRPVTAIREAAADGNDKTVADPTWEPLLETPPFPAYVSGHSTFSGAAAEVLAATLGTDQIRFVALSDGLPGVERRFKSFRAASMEAGMSRIYGGIHFDFDNVQGRLLGERIGRHAERESFLMEPATTRRALDHLCVD